MKGNMKVSVEVTRPSLHGEFDIADSWTYETDNTYESVEDWLDLFEKVLYSQGFSPYKLTIEEDYDEGEYDDGEYPDEAGV